MQLHQNLYWDSNLEDLSAIKEGICFFELTLEDYLKATLRKNRAYQAKLLNHKPENVISCSKTGSGDLF